MKTWNAKKENFENSRQWFLVDAEGQSVGRLASKIALVLSGKAKPTYTPHVDTGDMVVVVNADKVTLSGNKWLDKKYFRRSRFFGSLKETTAKEMLEKNPTFILKKSEIIHLNLKFKYIWMSDDKLDNSDMIFKSNLSKDLFEDSSRPRTQEEKEAQIDSNTNNKW